MNIKSLERKRKSMLTKDLKHCISCGMPKQDLHEIFEGAKRIASMQNDAVIPLCRTCHTKIHNDRNFALLYKRHYQREFEETHTREEFISIFKKNYL